MSLLAMETPPSLRGLVAFEDEETPEWRRAVLTDGAGGVPKFATKSECEDFVKRHCARGSNPHHPALQHSVTTLVDWAQIEDVLLPKMDEYDQRFPPQAPAAMVSAGNRFQRREDQDPEESGDGSGGRSSVAENVATRLELPVYARTNRESTMNTLKYLFHETRRGVFVMIRRRRVVLFVPFVNKDFSNAWGEELRFDSADGSMHEYHREKQRQHGREDVESDRVRWWNDGHAVVMDSTRSRSSEAMWQHADDHHLLQLRDLLEDACQHREIADCEFFINTQRHPKLKANVTEPFEFLFNRANGDDKSQDEEMPLRHHAYTSYAPVLSFYGSNRYADVLFPSAVDWEVATGLLFPQSFFHSHCEQCPCGDALNCENLWECDCPPQDGKKPHGIEEARDLFTAANLRKHAVPWEEKSATAFFRGAASGPSTELATNQRLQLAALSETWRHDPRYNGQEQENAPRFLDAAITSFPSSNIKSADTNAVVSYLKVDSLLPALGGETATGLAQYVPLYEQATCKYIVYVEGMTASSRYAYLMRMGSVILKVASPTTTAAAAQLWFSPLLRPFQDHVPVKADLSDLAEQIQWCRDHDDDCRAIAARASALYEQYMGKEAIQDYVELVCHGLATRFQPAPRWYHRPKGVDAMQKPVLHRPRSMCMGGSNARHCRRCREQKQEEDEARGRDQDRNRDHGRERGRERRSSREYGEDAHYGDRRRGGDGGYRGRDSGGSHYGDRYGGGDGGGHGHGHRRRDEEEDYHRGEQRYGSRDGSRREGSSPKRHKAHVVPQCRRCRRVKSACTCSYRR